VVTKATGKPSGRPSLREQLRQLFAEREERLSRPRDILLDFARSCSDGGGSDHENTFPATTADDFCAKATNIRAATVTMAKFYTGRLAGNIEALVRLLDDIPNPQRRQGAMTAVHMLIQNVRGHAEFGMPSPADELLTKLGTEHARSKNNTKRAEKQEQRRERLQPLVAEIVRERPEERDCPAKIATQLRRRSDFKDAPRRTLEEDVKAILKNLAAAE
jgi:hypothetical protein